MEAAGTIRRPLVIFSIGDNKYRLVIAIKYAPMACVHQGVITGVFVKVDHGNQANSQ